MKTNEAYRAAIEQKAAALLQRRKRRNRLLCTLIPTGGCAAVACAALLLSGAPADASSLPAAGTGPSAQSTAGSNLSSGAQTEGTAPLPALESIEFAELGGIGIGCRPFYDPETTTAETWTHQQAEDYIGRSLIPRYVLPGLVYPGGGSFRVYRNSDGTMAYDQVVEACMTTEAEECILPTEGEPLRKEFAVYASRLPDGPGYFFDWPEGTAGETRIGDVTVRFGHHAMGDGGTYAEPERFIDWYVAQFTIDGAEFKVISKNLTREEFLAMALSLLDEEDLEAAGIDSSALENAVQP